ncbi:MAG: hypothetical protein ACYCX3_14650 [Thermoleophilia bacterium]
MSGLVRVLGDLRPPALTGRAQLRPEQQVERGRKLWDQAGIRVDENSLEERLIELFLDVIGCRLVCEGAVHGEIERGLEIAGDDVELDVAGVEFARYFEKPGSDAILLPFEQLDRNGPLVVRLHEFLTLAFQLLALASEIAEFDF